MSELRQLHPILKVSQIKELPKCDFLVIGDSVQDVTILQSESKMKVALAKNVKVSLPKTFQTNKTQTKSLAIKGVPTDITDIEFLDLNKISYAKAERLKSKKDGRVLPIFRLEINDPTETEAPLLQNLVCQVTGIVYRVEEFRSPVSVTKCYSCQSVGHSVKKIEGQNKNVSSAVRAIPTNDAQIRKLENHRKGPHVALYKGCPEYKSRHLGNMRLTTKPQL